MSDPRSIHFATFASVMLLATLVITPAAGEPPPFVPAWTPLVAEGTPEAVPIMTGAIDEFRNRLVVFAPPPGGSSGVAVRTLDLSGPSSWRSVTIVGQAPADVSGGVMYDAAGDRLVFPMQGADSASIGTLSLEEPMRWSVFRPTGLGPGPRSGATMAVDPVRRRLLVHGGGWYRYDGIFLEFYTLDDTWAYSLDDARWTRIETTGRTPRRVAVHDQAYDSRHDRWVFGNRSTGCDSLRILDLASGVWAEIPSPVFEGPLAVWVYDPSRDWILSFGGERTAGDNPLHVLQLDPAPMWAYAPRPSSSVPVARYWPLFLLDASRDEVVMAGEYPCLVFPAKDGQGYPRTDAWRLALDSGRVPPPAVPAGHLALSPNPADRAVNVTFRLERTQQVTFDLLDLAGRLVHRCTLGTLGAGVHVRPVDLGGAWPAGVYFARLRLADGDAGCRIVIAH